MAAALNVLEPCSTGIGGDAFALYYDASNKSVTCLMGNGASSKNYSLEYLNSRGYGEGLGMVDVPKMSALNVTVPGAAALWEDILKRHGTMPLSTVLESAIDLASNGFPVGTVCAEQWSHTQIQGEEAARVLQPNGCPPKAGQIFTNPELANTFRRLGELGAKEGFYSGFVADAIVDAVREFGGVLDHEDLQAHETKYEEPMSIIYKGYRIYEVPPPTHGITALVALRLLEYLNPSSEPIEYSTDVSHRQVGDRDVQMLKSRGSLEQAHLGIECMRLAYSDSLQHVCDPYCSEMHSKGLLSDGYMKERAAQFSREAAGLIDPGDPSPFQYGDTVYFCTVDKHGNACSFINSNFMGFGTGIVPKGTGFSLQNRGWGFSLKPGHANQAAPRKKPYHTIIPGLITRAHDDSLFCTFGNMGGFMQPMGHVQLVRNMIDFKMDPQAAVCAPKWSLAGLEANLTLRDLQHSQVKLEDGYGGAQDGGERGDSGETIAAGLQRLGHNVDIVKGNERMLYGRGIRVS
jgi:gamma-glutamyltranspeptidase/glutathione hydrolase